MTALQGIVIAVRPRGARVRAGEREYDCVLPQSLIRGRREQRTLLAVGDRVAIEVLSGEQAAVRELLPRSTKISRVGSVRPRCEQVIAANVSQLVALQSIDQPRFNPRALDRLLVVGEVGGVRCAVVLNKIDLTTEPEAGRLVAPYQNAGYPSFLTSAKTGRGLEQLVAFLRDEKSIFVGPSGVGKSSLLNRLIPGLAQRTRRISRSTGKGRHTTSRVDYFDLPGGGALLDTPGLRAIQPWTEAPDLAAQFPEMRPHLGQCRFSDCLHRGEPDCAVRLALERGEIDRQRFEGYLRILESLRSEEA